MGKTYRQRQEEIRQQAIAFQHSFTEGQAYTWGELAEIANYFETMGRRYGLLEEFRNEGVL